MISNVASAINSFLPGEIIAVPASVLNTLVSKVQELTMKVEALEKRQDESQETLNLNIAQDRKRISTLESKSSASQVPSPQPGSKTASRISMIDQVLRERGPTVLKELCRILKILPQELSRILRRLDKRRFDLTTRPGDRRQKVLRPRNWRG
jgi:hypothetical protein